MKKKLFVLLVILAVVLTGVFAEDDPEVTVTLTGSIGPVFEHGVLESGNLLASKNITGALLPGGSSFDYAYTSNQTMSNSKLYMSVTDFLTEDETHSIQISSITVGASAATVGTNGILIFDGIQNVGVGSFTQKTIKVIAAQTESGKDYKNDDVVYAVSNAENGDYTATLTFSVVTE